MVMITIINLIIYDILEFLSDSSSSVPDSIKGVGSLTDPVAHAGHFSHASGVVTDGAISING